MQAGGAIPGGLTSARKLWSERISCNGQGGDGDGLVVKDEGLFAVVAGLVA